MSDQREREESAFVHGTVSRHPIKEIVDGEYPSRGIHPMLQHLEKK